MNLANKLTVIRIFLVPIFLIFIAVQGIPYGTFIATFIFVLASLTDKLDGYIARSRNQITNFGKFMDPLADKLLVTSALISLVELQMVPSWAAIVIIAREFAVSGLRTIAASEGKVIAASWWGKIKTVIQIIAIVLLLLQFNITTSSYLTNLVESSSVWNWFFMNVPSWMLNISVVITLISGWDYFRKNKHTIDMNK
ncbi:MULTISPECIES: CDP-diacylglycerol--glycerol-3-phosphate 3-phosphatidyltransferase [Clostridium]|uniref:CDP-diacylglycerol--glycerol-3-phosphate 3-phosphatidyltransferase n=1 Tax=Clostridium TaxID=1485 RepID=UPI00189D5938|nr:MULTISPECIES: CDP-diacylglycerol--glycerol-3-phosphate 3-phosphatidyltransferase [Clostridium]MBS7129736.1 CDP-diacylglycerol--glycerol-3-phosphate 3-phosphatidyltransferase [Clostridium sp.]MDB2116291.1 CDP-diacylglycerol--glycerol-3-phosphate 3-phosphatidyltransferase [Clostridium paraputrificum]MDU2282595.1 CDP-diacylglycerol--glycerol-3-phosphate 3-phosphatidyltransferase [Clostridium sp.]